MPHIVQGTLFLTWQIKFPDLTEFQSQQLMYDITDSVREQIPPALREVWSEGVEVDVADFGNASPAGLDAIINQQLAIANQCPWRADLKENLVLMPPGWTSGAVTGNGGDPTPYYIYENGVWKCIFPRTAGFQTKNDAGGEITPWIVAVPRDPGLSVAESRTVAISIAISIKAPV